LPKRWSKATRTPGPLSSSGPVRRQALLHRERLAADYPGVPQYTREMAVSLGGVANMLDSLGSYPEGEAAYLRAIHLMEGLPREVANAPDCRFELGLLYSECS
jgi:hypothetical protein